MHFDPVTKVRGLIVMGYKTNLCDNFSWVDFIYLTSFFWGIVWIDKLHDLIREFFCRKSNNWCCFLYFVVTLLAQAFCTQMHHVWKSRSSGYWETIFSKNMTLLQWGVTFHRNVARYSLKFSRCSLLVVKSLVTRRKTRSLLVVKNHSLLVEKFARYSL